MSLLYCIVLYCIVLYCIVLYCIVLYCIVLYFSLLYCIVLYCIVFFLLYCIVLYCIVLHYTALHDVVFTSTYATISNTEYLSVSLRNLDLDTSLMKWKAGALQHPVSVCSEPCRSGYFKSTRGQEACCWACIKCADYEILANERTCSACANGSYPDANQTSCVPIVVQHMTFDHPWAILLVAVSTTGILMVLFVFVVFVKYNRTPVIMASGRELCYMLQVCDAGCDRLRQN